ncbi:hypothetical protein H0H92_009595, partial [Tricholoma furcatifolium]
RDEKPGEEWKIRYSPEYWKYLPGSYGVYGAEMQNLPTSQSQKTLTDDIVRWLDRARGKPLSLHFDLSPNTQRGELETILRRYAASTRVLHLKGPLDMVPSPTRWIRQILRKNEGYLTSLEELKIGEMKAGSVTDSVTIDLSACKALRSFSAVNESPYEFDGFSRWITKTQLITGVPYAQLTSLHIVEQHMSQSFALSILRESKNLRTVILRYINWMSDTGKGIQNRIHLNFLETLDLSFSTWKGNGRYLMPGKETDSADFIDQLETPALRNLILAWDYDGPNIRVFQIIPQMLQGAQTSLRTLRLHGVRSDAKTLVQFLETLPRLHVVEIASPRLRTDRRDYGAIMEDLSQPKGNLLPHLKELTIWDNIVSRPFEEPFPSNVPHDAKELDRLCQDFSQAVTLIQRRKSGQVNVPAALQHVKLVFWVNDGYYNPDSPLRMDLEERLERLKQSSNDITPELVLHPIQYVPAWAPPPAHWPQHWSRLDDSSHKFFY